MTLSTEDSDAELRPQETNELVTTRKLHRLAFGFERIGFISLRFPYLCALAAVLLAALAVVGVGHIKVDDSLSQLFK